MNLGYHFRRSLWMVALILALIYLVEDSRVRMRGINLVTSSRIGQGIPPTVDPAYPSGWFGNQHNLVMPAIGTDGYHWMMQTDEMLYEHDWRVRHVPYDNPPEGRDIHWSGFLHWWLVGVAWISQGLAHIGVDHPSFAHFLGELIPGFDCSAIAKLPFPLVIEQVSPWVNTLCLAVVMVTLVPLMAWRFGSLAASLLALGFVAIYPYYEFSITGYYDHHGLAASSGLMTVLFLLAGGAGWIRTPGAEVTQLKAAEAALFGWLGDRRTAGRWFIVSAFFGGAGLWVSAATEIPTMFGIGLAVVLNGLVFAKSKSSKDPWRFEPKLWRLWGIAGCASSLFFYLLEYFPSNFTWRLEINHPLFALAWLGAGDLLCRFSQLVLDEIPVPAAVAAEVATPAKKKTRVSSGPTPEQRAARQSQLYWMGADLAAIALLPLAILIFGLKVFVIPDYFLWSLHTDYILEFRSLFRQMSYLSVTEIIGGISMLPMVLAPVATLIFMNSLLRPLRGLLVLAVFPAAVMLALAFKQIRWLGVDCAIFLSTLVGLIGAVTIASPRRGADAERPKVCADIVGIGGLLLLFVVSIAVVWYQEDVKTSLTIWAVWIAVLAIVAWFLGFSNSLPPELAKRQGALQNITGTLLAALLVSFAIAVVWFNFTENVEVIVWTCFALCLGGVFTLAGPNAPAYAENESVRPDLVLALGAVVVAPLLFWGACTSFGLSVAFVFTGGLLALLLGASLFSTEQIPLVGDRTRAALGAVLLAVVFGGLWLGLDLRWAIWLDAALAFALIPFAGDAGFPATKDRNKISLATLGAVLVLWGATYAVWKWQANIGSALSYLQAALGDPKNPDAATVDAAVREAAQTKITYLTDRSHAIQTGLKLLALLSLTLTGVGIGIGTPVPVRLPLGRNGFAFKLPTYGIFFLIFLIPIYPAFTLFSTKQWVNFNFVMPVSELDLTQVVTRDASQRLRQRLGKEPGVIVSGPTTTTWMMYFGGFKGLGTLYWENIDGLKHAAAIYSADSQETAKKLVDKYGVTHLAIYSWDAFAQEYSKLSRGLRLNDEVPSDAFILKILTTGNLPPWLRPVPYNLPPNNPNLKNQFVLLLEVVPNDSTTDALVRIANFLWASNKPEAAEGQLAAAFQQNPTYLPALIAEGRIRQALGKKDDVNRIVESIRANYDKAAKLSLEDHIDLASVFTYVGDTPKVLEQIQEAFRLADDRSLAPAPLPGEKPVDPATYVPPGEHALRRLTNEQLFNMLELGHQLGLLDAHAETAKFALTLLPPEFQAKVLTDIADAEARTGHFNEAVATYKKVVDDLQSNNLDALTNLAWILGTVSDPAVRDGNKALIYAKRAQLLDEHNRVETYDVLACAFAESGNFTGALENAKKALQLAQAGNVTDKISGIQKRIDLFTNKQPYRNN